MKSLDELNELKEKVQQDLKTRKADGKPKVIVGMGTCGIAAGAREIMQVLLEEIDKRKLDVVVTQTGCIGMCEKEPLVDVQLSGKNRITYGEVTKEAARRIISEHVVNGNIVEELVVAKLED
ncbi:(2Fe-2S) ferredoxin domain-containing protein [Acetohalobium arabaticum]|uniref:Ferredoxin-like protein n=1 Tax=Acetohalobium arabaticum (strain ATCC 49924 / DSM 5501 / Z-7288) TaxID=574087 RepID=D9QUI3_ACEAZ|nr:(2Fe-2S) ferredoxin domain-containing protein [Acetohalobium arabaticum]ADL13784.1 ferredoxin-like protein [Acetohalobium arabaticum DSM 5501]